MKALKTLLDISNLALDISTTLEWLHGIETSPLREEEELFINTQFEIIKSDNVMVTFFSNKFFIHNKDFKFSYLYNTFEDYEEIAECIIEDLEFIRFMNQ